MAGTGRMDGFHGPTVTVVVALAIANWLAVNKGLEGTPPDVQVIATATAHGLLVLQLGLRYVGVAHFYRPDNEGSHWVSTTLVGLMTLLGAVSISDVGFWTLAYAGVLILSALKNWELIRWVRSNPTGDDLSAMDEETLSGRFSDYAAPKILDATKVTFAPGLLGQVFTDFMKDEGVWEDTHQRHTKVREKRFLDFWRSELMVGLFFLAVAGTLLGSQSFPGFDKQTAEAFSLGFALLTILITIVTAWVGLRALERERKMSRPEDLA